MKQSLALLLGVALASQAAAQAAAPAKEPAPMPPVPETRVDPVVETIHGKKIVDPYRWLEGDNADANRMGQVTPEVAAWTDAENAYTRSILDHLPGRKALEDRIRPLMEIGAVSTPTV